MRPFCRLCWFSFAGREKVVNAFVVGGRKKDPRFLVAHSRVVGIGAISGQLRKKRCRIASGRPTACICCGCSCCCSSSIVCNGFDGTLSKIVLNRRDLSFWNRLSFLSNGRKREIVVRYICRCREQYGICVNSRLTDELPGCCGGAGFTGVWMLSVRAALGFVRLAAFCGLMSTGGDSATTRSMFSCICRGGWDCALVLLPVTTVC